MGKIIIQQETTKDPISLIGREAGVCWGSESNITKDFKRGIGCIRNNHGRTLEFPQIYMVLDGYSARVIREFYTHIAGGPTRLQSSTRYINYENFEYVIPPTIRKNKDTEDFYKKKMNEISDACAALEDVGIPREDAAMLLPLGMATKVIVRTNLRNLIDMSRQRMCSRAYWEFRDIMKDLISALREYSDEWEMLINDFNIFHPKCVDCGYCSESKGCGRYAARQD